MSRQVTVMTEWSMKVMSLQLIKIWHQTTIKLQRWSLRRQFPLANSTYYKPWINDTYLSEKLPEYMLRQQVEYLFLLVYNQIVTAYTSLLAIQVIQYCWLNSSNWAVLAQWPINQKWIVVVSPKFALGTLTKHRDAYHQQSQWPPRSKS